MRMKRFSSALCLADRQQRPPQAEVGSAVAQQQQQQQVASSPRVKLPQTADQSTQQQRKSVGKLASVKTKTPDDAHDRLHLAPDDPMILARQRRPSVSKGSVNVDQQGE